MRGESMVRTWRTLPMIVVDDYSTVDGDLLQKFADLFSRVARETRGPPLLAPLTEDFWADTIRDAASSGQPEIRSRLPAEPTMTMKDRVPGRDFYSEGGAQCCAPSSASCTCGFNEAGRPCCQESRMAWANGGGGWRWRERGRQPAPPRSGSAAVSGGVIALAAR